MVSSKILHGGIKMQRLSDIWKLYPDLFYKLEIILFALFSVKILANMKCYVFVHFWFWKGVFFWRRGNSYLLTFPCLPKSYSNLIWMSNFIICGNWILFRVSAICRVKGQWRTGRVAPFPHWGAPTFYFDDISTGVKQPFRWFSLCIY